MAAGKEQNFKIVEHIADLTEPTPKGWKKELNLVQWYDNEPKYDIRDWGPDHKGMGKGITVSFEELVAIAKAVEAIE